MNHIKYINWLSFLFCVIISTVTAGKSITEFRIKVGDVLERLTYPGKMANINELGDESIINTAIDFNKGSKPNFVQMAFVPKNKKFSDITFDMDYRESASKATLSVNLKRLRPGMIELGATYDLKISIAEPSKETIIWELGTLKMPESLEYKIPEIEDHFYKMPEIYTPEEEVTEGKKNPVVIVLGLVMVIALPWISFGRLWMKSGADFSIPNFLFDSSKSRAFPYFSVSLLAIVALIVSAWVYLSIFQTLGFLAILSSTAFAFGFVSFKSVVQHAEKQEKKDETKSE